MQLCLLKIVNDEAKPFTITTQLKHAVIHKPRFIWKRGSVFKHIRDFISSNHHLYGEQSKSSMATVKNLGILLIIVGVIMIVYTGFNYVTTEKVVDIGPIEINKDKNHFVQWSPVVGVLLLVAGVVAMMSSKKAV